MKKNTPFIILLLLSALGFSQSFNYQAVVRNAGGDPVVNQSIGVQIQILEGAAPDLVVYTETHTVTSSAQGIISLPIGIGATSDTFGTINWSQQNQWIGIAVDITGGTTYTSIGTNKLQQVPYALYATNSGDKTFDTTNNVTSNSNGTIDTDDFVFGSTQLDNISNNTDDNARMFFDKDKAAFRAGIVNDLSEGTPIPGDLWDDANIGYGSVALGADNAAKAGGSVVLGSNNSIESASSSSIALGLSNIINGSALSAFAVGDGNTASGNFAGAIGAGNTVGGNSNIAIGRGLTTNNKDAIALGYFNTEIVGSPGVPNPNQPLLILGNGTDAMNTSNALVMLHNGKTTLNGELTIDGDNQGAGTSYTLPGQDGTANQVMSTDGSGNVSWITQPATPSVIFSTTNNITSNANGNITTDDFVFGSTQLADDATTFDDNIRLFFDKSKGAFRAGYAQDDQWDDVNVGSRSVAFGNQNVASGFQSFIMGAHNTVSGPTSASFGANNNITGIGTFSTGEFLTAEARSQVTIGYLNTAEAGNALIKVPTDRLFVIGNGLDEMSRSDALVMLKNGNTTLNGSLTIDGDNQGAGTSYTLPAQDGAANQIMSTDGSGNVSWTAASEAFSTTSNVTSNANGTIATDDFVFGSTQLGDTGNTDNDRRLFFDKSKGAFRAGIAEGNEWDDASIGEFSVGLGRRASAGGSASISLGTFTTALGDESVAVGYAAGAYGLRSVAIGYRTLAQSKEQITIGTHNTIASGDLNNWVPTDRLFVIGNGDADSNGGGSSSRSDALVMLKNGNTTLNGSLTIDGDNAGSGASYTLPIQDGAANQIMTTDGSGTASWVDTPTGGAFSTIANVTSNANGTIATDDFVFGSTQLDNDTNTVDDDKRMFFDKGRGAFRAGEVEADEWDSTNIGTNSTSFGINNISSGAASFTGGDENQATTFAAIALGVANRATGSSSVAMGSGSKAESKGQISLGVNNTPLAGDPFTYILTDRLFVIGNGVSPSATPSDALVMLKNGNTTLNGSLTIDGDNAGSGASYTLPIQDGAANQIMSTDGSGIASWVDAPTSGTTLPAGGTNGQVLQTDGIGNYSWTNNTEAPGAFTPLTLNTAAGWEYYNAAFGVTNFQDPRYRKVNNIVYLEGMCRKNAAINNADTIMTLPVGFRPAKTRIFSVETENGSIRVDVNANGTVLVATGFNISQNWVSLDGITFSVD
ncbi:hypothetical protein [uncultured Aquimarina sp.]|uniref:beta strand repeat-containing protein n=1 Tax=uncultured Aquimarina sp. TaxID=575652 RepID=UPI002610B962|nr:hypothetical protein [uncultured Aquimarina sp.]